MSKKSRKATHDTEDISRASFIFPSISNCLKHASQGIFCRNHDFLKIYFRNFCWRKVAFPAQVQILVYDIEFKLWGFLFALKLWTTINIGVKV